MVELFDADLKRKGFDGVALPAGSYELHKINGVRLDINKSLDELGVQDGDTLVHGVGYRIPKVMPHRRIAASDRAVV